MGGAPGGFSAPRSAPPAFSRSSPSPVRSAPPVFRPSPAPSPGLPSVSRPAPSASTRSGIERSFSPQVDRNIAPRSSYSVKDRAVEPGRGFTRVPTPPPVSIQPRASARPAAPQSAAPLPRAGSTITPRGTQPPVPRDASPRSATPVSPRTDKARPASEARGNFDRSAVPAPRGAQGFAPGRAIPRTPLTRTPERSSGTIVPFKDRGDGPARGTNRFDGADRVAPLSPARRDSYSRWGRDHQWSDSRHHDGHRSYYGRYHDRGPSCYRPYARSCYRPCYGGYTYWYPRLYRSCYPYTYGYFGTSLFFDPYWNPGYYGTYGGGYSVVTYDTTPPVSYTYNNTTVYESAPAQTYAPAYTPSYEYGDAPQYRAPSEENAPASIAQPQGPDRTPPAEPSATREEVSPAPSGTEYQEPAAVREGHQHFGKGEFKEAQSTFLRALLADSGDAYARLFYAMSGMAVGDYAAAAAALRSALELAPDLIESPIDLRQFYRDAATLRSHVEGLGGWLQNRSGEPEARLLLAYTLFATGDPYGAEAELSRIESGSLVDHLVKPLREALNRVKAMTTPRTPVAPAAEAEPALP